MFDLFRLSESVGNFFGHSPLQSVADRMIGPLSEGNIDLSQFAEFDPASVVAALQDQGIDISQYDPAQIGEIVEGTGMDPSIAEALANFTQRGG